VELETDLTNTGGGGVAASVMPAVGVVVLAASSARLVRTLRSVQSAGARAVTIVVPLTVDPRAKVWLEALAASAGWHVVPTAAVSPGACWNHGILQIETEWVVLLDGGDRLRDGFAELPGARAVTADAAMAVGATRLVALGVDELVRPEDVSGLSYPVDPLLRAVCWRRDAVLAVGGLAERLTGALRYDLWLKMRAAGHAAAVAEGFFVEVGVAPGDSFNEELATNEHAEAVRAIHTKHSPLLRSNASAALKQRESRLAVLMARHRAGLARRAEAIRQRTVAERVDDSSTVDMAVDGRTLPRRVTPRSRDWGYERGGPIDRVYIERFLAQNAADVRGAVLEVQEDDYTRRFGGSGVTRSDVVDVDESNRNATIIADLRAAPNIPAASYDCVILTQTLHVIDDMAAVVAECWRVLKPGGVLLATLPSASRVCLEYGPEGDYWRVTPAGAQLLFRDRFGPAVDITIFGNALATSAFTLGLGRDEVGVDELELTDPFNPMLVGVRATKAGQPGAPAVSRATRSQGLALLYHRVGASDPDPHRINVPRQPFADQMSWLKAHCAVIPLDELRAGAERGTLPPRAIALTFDDGYEDSLMVAAPVLKALQLPATCFVTTEDLEGTHEFWWDTLASALLGEGAYPSTLSVSLPGGPQTVPTATRGERLFAHGLIYHAIVGEPASTRSAVVSAVRGWAPSEVGGPTGRRMTAGGIARLADYGVAVGAHTVRHPQLPRLSQADQVREIADCRATLERLVKAPVRSLAYPFGAFDATTVAAAREAGIESAWTCEPRAVGRADEPLSMPRLDPQATDMSRFVGRLEATLAQLT
jgi:peptidoglycan/xylan/chitin deacetylase (PgdA/CDA1 family)